MVRTFRCNTDPAVPSRPRVQRPLNRPTRERFVGTRYGYDATVAYINSQDDVQEETAIGHLHTDIFTADIDRNCARERGSSSHSHGEGDTEEWAVEPSPVAPESSPGMPTPTSSADMDTRSSRGSRGRVPCFYTPELVRRASEDGCAYVPDADAEVPGPGISLPRWLEDVESSRLSSSSSIVEEDGSASSDVPDARGGVDVELPSPLPNQVLDGGKVTFGNVELEGEFSSIPLDD
ncbi:hypothetical protein GMORB2_6951 [Geosmithia morbida]|uniref:Uncharacterized protein n=1 Tax=Geosmithia morbida TaxID=1094350 RepID=A0A9P5D5M4_9HYPO|nr:uncharacterized protein GMORB2_6951 [Geosmithia morbida]KAF4122644.1 hypothetical protein GMORB2_6951 [Geosmithia morbida]